MWVVVDQAVSSASTFALTFIVGRSLGPVDLGSFSLVFAVWLIVFGLFKAVIEDPLAIYGELSGGDGAYLAAAIQTAIVALVTMILAGVCLLIVGGPATVVITLGLVVPGLLIQDLWRRVAFLRSRPKAALGNDLTFLAVQLSAVALFKGLGALSLSSIIFSWGMGATAGAALGAVQFRPMLGSVQQGHAFLRAGRHVSGWLVLDFVVNRWLRQAVLFIIALTVGKAALGGIQASANILGFTNIVILGASSAALAEGANALRSHGESAMHRVLSVNAFVLALAVGLVCLAYAGGSEWLLRHVYGPQFTVYAALGPLVALQTFVSCLETFPVIKLRLLRNTKRLFVFRAIFAPIGLAIAFALCITFGATGAAAGTVATAAGLTAGAWAALVWHAPVRQSA